jgi:C1A family cysteine protease
MAALTKGPVSVALAAGNTFFKNYKGGIIDSPFCPTNLDHGVLLVGYGQDSFGEKYWTIKNSWGNTWGERGFARLLRNITQEDSMGQCGI